jgi:hypothetical protein
VVGNSIIGATSLTVGDVVGKADNSLKIKLANIYESFSIGENLLSNTAILATYNVFSDVSGLIDGVSNTFSIPVSGMPSDAIQVYVDGNILDPQYYVRYSTDTIRFIPRDRLLNSESDQVVLG